MRQLLPAVQPLRCRLEVPALSPFLCPAADPGQVPDPMGCFPAPGRPSPACPFAWAGLPSSHRITPYNCRFPVCYMLFAIGNTPAPGPRQAAEHHPGYISIRNTEKGSLPLSYPCLSVVLLVSYHCLTNGGPRRSQEWPGSGPFPPLPRSRNMSLPNSASPPSAVGALFVSQIGRRAHYRTTI
jgi:hypothetical protein